MGENNVQTNEKVKGRFKWTLRRTAKLIALYKGSYRIKYIADYFEVTENSVKAKIRRLKDKGEL